MVEKLSCPQVKFQTSILKFKTHKFEGQFDLEGQGQVTSFSNTSNPRLSDGQYS